MEKNNSDMERIAELFKGIKFKRQIIGGVSQTSVWRRLGDIQSEYRKIYEAQQLKYETIISEKERQIAELEERVRGSNG